MLRATRLLAISLICGAFLPALLVATEQPVNMINGIGLIDYSRKPSFKVGSWTRYRVTGSSELGMVDDYTVTVVIAGEEKFWDEDCFWVETWTEPKNGPPVTVATLMSYAIFGDTLAVPHMQLYSRKIITEVDPEGRPNQVVTKRSSGSLRSRKPVADRTSWYVDTLGRESVTAPRGTFDCLKISMRQGIATTTDVSDSTIRTEVRDDRVIYMSDRVPITGIVREDIGSSILRKTWKIGQSENAPTRTLEDAKGTAWLVDFGEGQAPQLVPEASRHKIRESLPARTQSPAPARSGAKRRARG